MDTAEDNSDDLTLATCTKGEVILPCGYIDAEGKVHDRASIREMTGEEEDVLAARNMDMGMKLTVIIGNCLKRLGAIQERAELRKAAGKLTIGDRIVLLLALRIASLGSWYSFSVKCPNCSTAQNHGLNLETLKVKAMTDKSVRRLELDLPSGRKAVLKVMTAEDELQLEKYKGQRDVLSLSIMVRLASLDGNEKLGLKDVKGLSWRDRHFLREKFMAVEGGVDTDIEIQCAECREEFKSVLDVGQPSFLFPKGLETTAG